MPATKKATRRLILGRNPPRRAPTHVSKNRSGASVVQSAIRIKVWQQQLPTVEEVRPGRCPACKAASCPVGRAHQLHGHGTRKRQVRGPSGPGQPAATVEILARRYRCILCGAVIVVVPQEVRARRLYSASAIGLALLWEPRFTRL